MIEVDPPDIFGSTIFCDDIRQEMTGKWIYLGAYQGSLVIQGEVPVTLPRFCFSINLVVKQGLLVSPVAIKIFVPGDDDTSPSIEAELGETVEGGIAKAASDASAAMGIPVESQKYTVLFSNMVFENFILKGAGTIRVRADIDGKRYKLGSLNVSRATSNSPA